MKKWLLYLYAISLPSALMSQLNIQGNARVNIQPGAFLVATGNIVSTSPVAGTGTLILKGTSLQQVNFGGQSVPVLRIDNSSGVAMTGAMKIGSQLNFVNGKLFTGNNILTLEQVATTSGGAVGKFIEINGTGDVRKLLTSNLNLFILPIGKGTEYTPVDLTTSGTYVSAYVRVRPVNGVHPNKPASVSNYLNSYITIGRSGITGSLVVHAIYANSSIVGNEGTYLPFFWTGTSWSKTGTSINTVDNRLTATITGSGGDMYAMNDFVPLTQNIAPGAVEAMNTSVYRESLYPNPARQSTNLSIYSSGNVKAELVVIDMKGAVVQQKTVSLLKGFNQLQFGLEALSAGNYEIRVMTSESTKTFRLMKK